MEKDFTLCTSTKGFGAVSKNNKYVEKVIFLLVLETTIHIQKYFIMNKILLFY